jgi:2,4-dienoyl-CoA reductase (NADPH2)
MAAASTSRHERFDFATIDALAKRIRELNVDIPLTSDLEVLFTPVDVVGRRLPNRFAVQPMEGRDSEADGAPGPLTFRRYRRYVAGGSGLIWFEATAVVPEGRASPAQLCISDANFGEFRHLVEETRAAAHEAFDDSHDVLLVLQLTHAGRYSRPAGMPRPLIAHHSRILDPLTGVTPEHPTVTDDELDRLQVAFAHAAELAATAGFDGVDVKACHGYLVSELLASFTRANSRYGGSLENRTRFLLEVAARIRKSVPAVFVTSRINAYDGVPYPYGFGVDEHEPTRESLVELEQLARWLRDVGCPLLNVSIGNPRYKPHYGRPYDKPIAGEYRPDEHPLVSVARLLRITGTLQQAVPDLPLVGTGYSWLRQFVPNVAAAVIKSGKAAFVGLGRGALAYPDCVKDLAEKGSLDPAKTCTACSGCSQIMRDGGRVGCVVHDREIYAEEYEQGRRRAERPPDP